MKILIAIDFSEKSVELVEKTVSLLRNALDSVCLLHVANPIRISWVMGWTPRSCVTR
jgi:hypothetical protein